VPLSPGGDNDVRSRPQVRSRFLDVSGRRQYIRGVTYGTFPHRDGCPYPDVETVAADFAAIAACGANAVRLYATPPRWLLDLAHEHGLAAMVGLAWEEHVAFLDDRRHARQIVERIRRDAATCAGHPALLCFAVGNEIPASIVRWHGGRRVERFLDRLCSAVRDVDPEALLTYVNYPSTEYLELPFLDLVCFNVYLESPERFPAYLARLHNIAGERPLVIAELGLDSKRNGEDVQARVLARQVRAAYASGCAGVFVFSWTDEWSRGDVEVEDWSFGLVDRDRRPKQALLAVARAFAETPLETRSTCPRISVVVCTHNGAATVGSCLDALSRVDYPNCEVIVVDDGSDDATPSIAAEFDVRLVCTANHGLSSARNTGLAAATGEIVAFTDDDAYPDRDWLRYLARAFDTSDHVGIGGPNLAPPGGSLVERAVACAPGGPMHVLLSDDVAEHIPGCNMAFRRDALQAIGGFDPQFRIAGDDVDVCWRLQERGWTIGFSAAGVVLHRRRRSVRAYLRQQAEYGKAEALLERKWPERYNRGGHLAWAGRVYGAPLRIGRRRPRVAYGTWGSNLFQSLYHQAPSTVGTLTLMPEWFLVIGAFGVLALVGAFTGPLVPWTEDLPVRAELLLFAAATIAVLVNAVRAVWLARSRAVHGGIGVLVLATVLSALQPAARLVGRLRNGLTPWRRRGTRSFVAPWPRRRRVWAERWRSPEERLRGIEGDLRARLLHVARGGDFDRWELRVRVGPLACASVRIAVEEHGQGRQLVRYRIWPRLSRLVPAVAAVLLLWLIGSIDREPIVAAAIASLLVLTAGRALLEVGASLGVLLDAVERAAARELERGQTHTQFDELPLPEQPSASGERNGDPSDADASPREVELAHVLDGRV
jgi:O-antigen biosynthesis protein